jgi:F-type H+-transporting ATPase subunit a
MSEGPTEKRTFLKKLADRAQPSLTIGSLFSGVNISLRAENVFHIGGFPVSNTLLVSTLAVLLLAGLGFLLRKKISLIPGKLQNLFEVALEGLLELMDSVLGKRAYSEKYLPIVATIFVFIMTSNWLGLMPGVSSILIKEGHENIPLFRSPASDLNFTLALAVLSVVSTHVIGILAIGFFKHSKKFFYVGNPIKSFVGILEFVSEFAKMVSFSFRLFGNVFAGEVLLSIIGFLVPYFVPLPFLFLELFVGFIQAFIFSMLTLVFIASAITEGEH